MKPQTSGKKEKATKFHFDRLGIRNIANRDRADELTTLSNVDVFNQLDFEQGVLQQANDAFAQDCERQKSSIQREIASIEEDIRHCEDELANIGELLERLDSRSNPEDKQKVVSIKNQEKNKTNQLRTLHTRRHALEQKLSRIAERPQASSSADVFGFVATETEEARKVRLGEMTPFQARKQGEGSTAAAHTNPVASSSSYVHPLKSKPAKKLRQQDNDVWSPKGGDDNDDDDDYEDVGSDISYETDEELGEPKKSGKRKFKRKRVKLWRKGKALEDDWCEEVYKGRIRELQVSDSGRVEEEDEEEQFDGGFKVPGKVWGRLFPYQKTGVRWLWELHTQEVGGILGDEMGLGKTVQVIAFLASLYHSKIVDKSMIPRYHGLGPVLIMCPTTVMQQWLREFRTWWPQFRVVIVHSNSGASSLKTGQLLASLFPSSRGHKGEGQETSLIVVSSYNTVHRYCDEFLRYPWHYLVLDEGHKIRNPDAQITLVCKQFRTCHRIIMSGSPVQNNLKELWSLFDFIFPGKLGTLPDFMTHFSVPISQGQYATSSDVQVQTAFKCAETLRDIIVPYLLRRMKSDVQSSLSLPDKNEQVLFCRLTDYQRKVYKEFLESNDYQMILQGRTTAFSGLITVRKICNHPDICTGTPKSFWSGEDSPEFGESYGYWKRSGKMIVVEALLAMWRKQQRKVLFFTQSRQMLNIIEAFVRSRKYTYFRMDGATSVQTRQPLVNEFNKNPNIFLFLLTTRVGGLGINLTGASRVVIYDPDWNPSTDVQARERAWRIGQKMDVTVYRLLTTGTIEEKIYQRQIFKQFLTNRVLSDPRQRRFFDSGDLRELFTLTEDTGSSETSSIFAGTGSDVKVSSLRKKLKKSKRKRDGEEEEEEEEDGRRLKKKMKKGDKGGVEWKSSTDSRRMNRFDALKDKPVADAVIDGDEDNVHGYSNQSDMHGDSSSSKLNNGSEADDIARFNVANSLMPSSSLSPASTDDNAADISNDKTFPDVSEDRGRTSATRCSDSLAADLVLPDDGILPTDRSLEINQGDLSREAARDGSNSIDDSKEISTSVSTEDNRSIHQSMEILVERSSSMERTAEAPSVRNAEGSSENRPTASADVPDGCDSYELHENLGIRNGSLDRHLEKGDGKVEDVVVVDDDDEVTRWRNLAKSLSQKIAGMNFTKVMTSDPSSRQKGRKKKKSKEEDERKKKKKKKKNEGRVSRDAKLDGSEISNLDRVGEYGERGGDDDDGDGDGDNKKKKCEDDDYILRKLFKKSGIHSAMHHDRIVSSSDPDYRLVEMEAERVAKEAERALRASRERCRQGALPGQPTWTGMNGSVGAPRFGPRKTIALNLLATSRKVVGSTKEKECAASISSKIPSSLSTPGKPPKPKKCPPGSSLDSSTPCHFDGSALVDSTPTESKSDDVVKIKHHFQEEQNRSKQKTVSSTELLSMLKSKRPPATESSNPIESAPPRGSDTPDSLDNEHLELMEDIRAFVSIGGDLGSGSVTSDELVNHFRSKVPAEKSAIFKEMTNQLCTFRRSNGVGVFGLRPEFRRED